MFENKVGLEAEFFVFDDVDKNPVFPADYGFDTDEFPILGEFRAPPGKTRAETVGNFLTEWYKTKEKAEKAGVTIHLGSGHVLVTPEFYAEILRRMGTKSIAQCKNIYDTDLLTYTDAEIKNGKIFRHFLSIGLHVHFSSLQVEKRYWKEDKDVYTPIEIPLGIGDAGTVNLSLYKKSEVKSIEREVKVSASRITKPVIYHFIKEFDENILHRYISNERTLKYRLPGFYEIKPHGFEYRSLPFSTKVFDNIYSIVDFSFNLLENL